MKLGQKIIAIPLAHAALCASCEAVFPLDEWDRCPACADSHFLPLESIVGSIRVANETAGAAMNDSGQPQEGGTR